MIPSIRCFIAVEISEEIRYQLKDILNQLKATDGDVKWVRPEATHLTLKFLGDVSTSQIEPIAEIVQKTVADFHQFQAHIVGSGAFPNFHRPRVFWLGIREGCDPLVKLANKFESNLLTLGFEKEKRSFKSHLTLGRVRSMRQIEKVQQVLSDIDIDTWFDVDQIVFMKSDLKPTGAVYTPVHQFQLRG